MGHLTDEERIEHTHNASRYAVEFPQITWVLLVFTVLWGVFGYYAMPQRKDPDVPVRQAVSLTSWRGMSAEKVEQLVTKAVEEKMADNSKVDKLESTVRNGISINYVYLEQSVNDTAKEFDDIALKLQGTQLPDGAGPVNFIRDFGDTAALMLTVASPRTTREELIPRALTIRHQIEAVRATVKSKPRPGEQRVTILYGFPDSVSLRRANEPAELFRRAAEHDGLARDMKVVQGPGFIGMDGWTRASDEKLQKYLQGFLRDRLQMAQFHPDSWDAALIRDPRTTLDTVAAVAGDKYSYEQLETLPSFWKRASRSSPRWPRSRAAGSSSKWCSWCIRRNGSALTA
ncbi:MAG: efflux RND transporter permease subunit [Armatimonadetes bacterium]|nr:efflux RND transporter permease subunit [Armatimonadota bacterium]